MTASLAHEPEVIAATFEDDDEAFIALTKLKELDGQGQIEVRAAVVVTRDEGGRIVVKDQVPGTEFVGTATGGIIGLLIGILGGPLGILVGGATGLLVGLLVDVEDEEDTDSVLENFSRRVRVGHNTLLAEITEPSHDIVDNAIRQSNGTILRRGLLDVEAEIASANEAAREAKLKARRELHKRRREQHKEDVQAKIADMKSKLHVTSNAQPETSPSSSQAEVAHVN